MTGAWHLTLEPNKEIFTPEPLVAGHKYAVTIEGVCAEKAWWAATRTDVCYRAHQSNFTERKYRLFFDMEKVKCEPSEEDRDSHRYTFCFTGKGKKLSLLWEAYPGEASRVRGSFQVTICQSTRQPVASQETLAARQREQAAQARLKRELEERVLSLRLQARIYGDLLDPVVREAYAQAKYREILEEQKKNWVYEYQQVMLNAPLLDELRGQAPDVLAWLEARIELIRLAERFAITLAGSRTKPTPEEWREKAVQYSQVQAEDEAAKFFSALESELKVREAVKAKEQEILQRTDLSEEEKQEYLRIVRDMAAARLHVMGERKPPGDNDHEDATILK